MQKTTMWTNVSVVEVNLYWRWCNQILGLMQKTQSHRVQSDGDVSSPSSWNWWIDHFHGSSVWLETLDFSLIDFYHEMIDSRDAAERHTVQGSGGLRSSSGLHDRTYVNMDVERDLSLHHKNQRFRTWNKEWQRKHEDCMKYDQKIKVDWTEWECCDVSDIK